MRGEFFSDPEQNEAIARKLPRHQRLYVGDVVLEHIGLWEFTSHRWYSYGFFLQGNKPHNLSTYETPAALAAELYSYDIAALARQMPQRPCRTYLLFYTAAYGWSYRPPTTSEQIQTMLRYGERPNLRTLMQIPNEPVRPKRGENHDDKSWVKASNISHPMDAWARPGGVRYNRD